jgi:predicted nuclease of predicted toxin-antitoxin system
MRWLADECVDAALVRHLRGGGHDVIYAAEVAAGTTDAQLLRRANDEHRLLLTEDKDFGELVFRLHMTVPGLVLMRIAPESISSNGPVWTPPCKGLAKGCLDVTLSSRKLGSGRGLCWALYLCGSVRVVLTKNIGIGCGFNIAPMCDPLRLAEDYAMSHRQDWQPTRSLSGSR